MLRLARTLAATLLVVATLAAAQHGHCGSSEPRAPQCASCAFADSHGASSVAPPLPAPVELPLAAPPRLVVAAGFALPPLSRAPKNGPPA